MQTFKSIIASALSLGAFLIADNAVASVIDGSFTATVTSYSGPPADDILGDTFDGSFSYDLSQFQAVPGGGYTFTSPMSGSSFVYSYNVALSGAGVNTGSVGAFATVGSDGSIDLEPGAHLFLDFESNLAGGQVAFGGGTYFFTTDTVSVSSVPLSSSLLMFAASIVGLGTFALRRKEEFPR